jgi:PAS domain S-box-containing protein
VFKSAVDDHALRRAIAEATDDIIISSDRDDVITSWNAAATGLYGYTEPEMIGRPFSTLVPADRVDEERTFRTRALSGEAVRDCATRRRRADGSEISIVETLLPVRASDGSVVGVLRVANLGGDRQQAQRAARRLASIVESSEDAIVSKDLNGIVMSWNGAAEKMFGYTAEEITGQSIRTIIPADLQHEEDLVLSRIRRGERVEHFETVRRRKDGTVLPVSLTVSPIRDLSGRVVGASKIARDISERKREDAERQKLHEVGTIVSATLDRNTIVQAVTDIATELTGAQFGAFFYNVVDERGETHQLYAISGAPREAFSQFQMPRNTEVFAPTFTGGSILRSDDITQDPRYARNLPHRGMPEGHLPLRSYLAVPVTSPSGEVFGGLIFGHAAAGRFGDRHERLAVGVASWASVALENARLYVSVQEANRLKDEFLATLSHELRTPLNAILGYARMMRLGILAPHKLARTIEIIERNATSLTQIVEDVLDVSRIVSGKMRLSMQSVDLVALVRQAVDAARPAAEAKQIVLDLAGDTGSLPISADPDRLQQVLWNIMSNAVKFTGTRGRVSVSIERADERVDITVQDTGIGIPPAFLSHIFERFRQAESGSSRERGGLGLGLSIAHQLIEMHGGTITAESAGVGQGSTFRIVLPTTTARLEQSMRDQPHGMLRPEAARPSLANLRGVRVLVVDDDPDALSLVREILENAGAEMVLAASGPEALALLERQPVHVLVCDLAMPRMDGFELIARVRHHPDPAINALPAAALTAYARSEDSVRAWRSGFHRHLAKPIDPTELTAAIASLVGRAPQR